MQGICLSETILGKHNKGFRKHKSIFGKLILIFILTGILINGAVGFFWNNILRQSTTETFRTNLEHYAQLVSKEFESREDTLKIQQLSDQLNLEIHVRDDSGSWETTPHFFEHYIRIKKHYGQKNPIFIHGNAYYEFKQPHQTILYGIRNKHSPDQIFGIIGLIAVVSLIVVFAYHTIKWVLRPIQWLTKGVEEISNENLDVSIPVRGEDELGRLSKSFNQMTHRIRQMLEAQRQLLYNVSHELRTPITRTKLALESVDKSTAKKSIEDDIHEMETMITEILESERIQSQHGGLKCREENIIALIQLIVDALNRTGKNIRTDFPVDPVLLSIDTDRVQLAIKNVIENAVKYSEDIDEPVRISCRSAGGNVIIIVRDFGPGIAEKEIPFVTEPFYRVDKSRSRDTGGFGLGLSLVKTIMKAHNGSIEINSTLGKGTEIRLIFPV